MTYQLKVDSHVHTINSVHAYSTIAECTKEALGKGVNCIVITDYFGPFFLNGSLFQLYAGITNLLRVPSVINGVKIINGAEIDIVNRMEI